jgi:hypothetical protein
MEGSEKKQTDKGAKFEDNEVGYTGVLGINSPDGVLQSLGVNKLAKIRNQLWK